MRIIRFVLAAAAMQAAIGIAPAHAQAYPNKPVKAIITFTPGSATDIVGRIVVQKLAEYWGQPVVPENRAGAGGSIGAAAVAKMEADGYTLLINSNAQAINPSIYANLQYDSVRDFIDVSPLAMQPNVFVVNAASPYMTLMDFVNGAKAKPGALTIGHAGVGGGTHLNTERFVAAAGIQILQVPHKGTPEAVTGVLNGTVDSFWAPISSAIPHIKSGKLRPLAVSTPKRSPLLTDVPTTGEAGVQGADTPLWFGLWVATGTPQAIVDKLSADTRRALADPGVREKLINLGNDPMIMSPEEFRVFVRQQTADYAKALQAAGVKPQ